MSVLQMSLVWKLDLPHPQQAVLLALADHAHDDGTSARPSLGYVAWKTGYSLASVKRTVRSLRAKGLIQVQIPGGGRTSTVYLLCLDHAKQKGSYHRLGSEMDRGHFDTGVMGDPPAGSRVTPQQGHSYELGTIIKPSVDLPVVDLELVVRTSRTKSSTRGDGEVGAVVDAFRAIPGVTASRKDGGVLAGLVGKYGAAAVRRVLEVEGPSIAAADNPLLYLASPNRFRQSGRLLGQTLTERKAEILRTLKGDVTL